MKHIACISVKSFQKLRERTPPFHTEQPRLWWSGQNEAMTIPVRIILSWTLVEIGAQSHSRIPTLDVRKRYLLSPNQLEPSPHRFREQICRNPVIPLLQKNETPADLHPCHQRALKHQEGLGLRIWSSFLRPQFEVTAITYITSRNLSWIKMEKLRFEFSKDNSHLSSDKGASPTTT